MLFMAAGRGTHDAPPAARCLAFEQPCRQLIGFFHTEVCEGRVRLYALNPHTPHTPMAMRQAFTPSLDKTDARDVTAIADVLAHHEDKLARWLRLRGVRRRIAGCRLISTWSHYSFSILGTQS